ncbi:MAG: efflux transporter periplasmic adaptor subunit [Alteromonadaceae bacterium]|nr:MAG: efflux transporter periplasmic adaptor subunit [Alteromonadaceae bacterium]
MAIYRANTLQRLCLTFISSLLLTACEPDDKVTSLEPIRLVRTHQVVAQDGNIWHELPGHVDVAKRADLSFRVSGKLEQMLVSEGNTVEVGQLLAKLNDTDFVIQLNSLKAQYKRAQQDFDRAQSLVEKGVISRSNFNNFETDEATAKASLEAAEQNLAYTQLRAPFSGQIAKRYVDNYEEVNAKQFVFTLQDLDTLTVKVDVPESFMINVRQGQRPEVYALFDSIPKQQFPLTFQEVATQANSDANTFEVTFALPPIEEYTVLPGMSVTARAAPISREPSLASRIFVPTHAVLQDDAGTYVWLVNATALGMGKVFRQNVSVGTLSQLGLEVVDGLHGEEHLVSAGMSKMYEGLDVRFEPETKRL